MGRTNLIGMLEATDESTALHWHLTHNMYPSVPAAFFLLAQSAIAVATDALADGPYDYIGQAEELREPFVCLFHNRKPLSVMEIIEQLQLGEFVMARLEME